MRRGLSAIIAAIVGIGGLPFTAQAAELIVYTGMGSANGTYEVAEGFQKASGHKVTVSFESGPSLNQKLEAKAPADLITTGVEGMEALVKAGHIVARHQHAVRHGGARRVRAGRRGAPGCEHARGVQGGDAGGEIDRLFARLQRSACRRHHAEDRDRRSDQGQGQAHRRRPGRRIPGQGRL